MSIMDGEAPSNQRAALEAEIERIKTQLRRVPASLERQNLIDALVEAALALAKLSSLCQAKSSCVAVFHPAYRH
jgi:hypothetical protein